MSIFLKTSSNVGKEQDQSTVKYSTLASAGWKKKSNQIDVFKNCAWVPSICPLDIGPHPEFFYKLGAT